MSNSQGFSKTSIVLVTGANGHVAQHVVSQLLSRPEGSRPQVRATVRNEISATGLKSTFHENIKSGELKIVFIPDIAVPGAFDSVVNGCTQIAHIASPLVVGAADVEKDVLKPAIQGTTGLLKSASRVSTVKQVVITSSFAAIHDPMYGLRPAYTYTSRDWMPVTYDIVADPNLDLSQWPPSYQGFITYMASKKLAEEAAWNFHRQVRPS